MAITDKCMLIDLTVGAWEGRKLDKDASDRVTEEAQAVSGTARVNKLLLPKEVLDPILLKRNQIRRFVYDKTVPWSDAGPRLLTRIGYQPRRSRRRPSSARPSGARPRRSGGPRRRR